jgi:hypothetical protein
MFETWSLTARLFLGSGLFAGGGLIAFFGGQILKDAWDFNRKATSITAISGSVQLILHIDEVTGDDASFRLTATNIGSAPVGISRVAFSTTVVNNFEPEKNAKREVPPGGKIDYRGVSPNGLSKSKKLAAKIEYDVKGRPEPNTFTSQFGFELGIGSVTVGDFNPAEWNTQAGTIEAISGTAVAGQAEIALSLPTGTLLLDLPEMRPEGTPNYVTIAGSNRYFVFDPVRRLVTFTVVYGNTPSTKTMNLLARADGAPHKVAITWEDAKRDTQIALDGKLATEH